MLGTKDVISYFVSVVGWFSHCIEAFMYLSFYSANCKAQDVFDFAEFEEKYGKNQKPAFLKSMAEARDARSGTEAIIEETGGEKKRASRVSRTSEKLGYYRTVLALQIMGLGRGCHSVIPYRHFNMAFHDTLSQKYVYTDFIFLFAHTILQPYLLISHHFVCKQMVFQYLYEIFFSIFSLVAIIRIVLLFTLLAYYDFRTCDMATSIFTKF